MIVENGELPQAERDDQLLESCVLYARLFLWPESVLQIVSYWMSNYSDYNLAEYEEDQFNCLIQGLLENPVRLEISASEGLANRQATRVKYQAVLQFVGTPYHRIPLEYFFAQGNITLFQCLSRLTNPDKAYFQQRNAGGLDGELQLGSFIHDSVGEYFYEPTLMILCAYMIHMFQLRACTGCRVQEDWLPRHFYSLRALDEESLERVSCFRQEWRREELREELRVVYRALNTENLDQAIEACCSLIREKSTECYQLMFIRRDSLFL